MQEPFNYSVCARRPCWRGKTIKLFSFGKKFNSHAKIFLLFTRPTWPPRTDSSHRHSFGSSRVYVTKPYREHLRGRLKWSTREGSFLVCVAIVSVRFRSKKRGTRVKDRATNGSRFISRSVKTENPLPRSFFAPKPNGNACYAG